MKILSQNVISKVLLRLGITYIQVMETYVIRHILLLLLLLLYPSTEVTTK